MALQNPDFQQGDGNAIAPEQSREEYTWRIENFSHIAGTKLISTDFEIGTYTWRLLLFPRGTGSQDAGDAMAVCLTYPEASFTPLMICPKAHFEVTAVNQKSEEKSLKRETNHMFTAQAADWGFTEFLRLEDVLNSESGFVVNDTFIIKISIELQKRDQVHMISREQTGFAGLKNQGSTGYLNAVLQYLFHIPYLRKAVYKMPTLEMDETKRCVSLAMQSLFYKLQYQKSNVSTRALTNSFGWGEEEVLLQHDVQEMLAMLRGNLEENMRGTDVDTTIPDLFAGHYSYYTQCLEVDHTVAREQPFMDISLDVHNCKDIYESLDKFCADEKLDGQNKYRTEEFGLQDARRFARFETFPPVLQLQLQRFDYDYVRNVMFKNNSRYAFYDELDLDCKDRAFLSETSDKTAENKYRLHCVFTHTGGAAGGTYSVFVKSDGKWYKFEDELVTEVTEEAAISEQFGGEEVSAASTSATGQTPNKSTAYILVYVRISEWDRIMCKCGKEDIAEPLRMSLESEQVMKEQRQKEKKDAHLHVAIKVATEKHFAEQLGEKFYFDMADFDRVSTYRLHKKTLFKDFKERIGKDFGIPTQLQRFWLWTQRQNGSMRLAEPLDTSAANVETVLDLKNLKEKTAMPALEKTALLTIQLFLENPEPDKRLHQMQEGELLLFVKLYNPKTAKLSYVAHMFVYASLALTGSLRYAASLAGFTSSNDVVGYHVKHETDVVCVELNETETPEERLMCHGDVIVIQERVTEEQQMQHNYAHPTVSSFLDSCKRAL